MKELSHSKLGLQPCKATSRGALLEKVSDSSAERPNFLQPRRKSAHPVPNAHVIDLTGSESPKSRWCKYTLKAKKQKRSKWEPTQYSNHPRFVDSDKSLLRLIGYKSSGTSRRGSGPGFKLTMNLRLTILIGAS